MKFGRSLRLLVDCLGFVDPNGSSRRRRQTLGDHDRNERFRHEEFDKIERSPEVNGERFAYLMLKDQYMVEMVSHERVRPGQDERRGIRRYIDP